MDALSVKNATAFAKQYVIENGPLVMEMVRGAFFLFWLTLSTLYEACSIAML